MSVQRNTTKKTNKKHKTIREQCALEMELMEERLSTNFNSKLDRIERVLAAMGPDPPAPPPVADGQPPPPKRTCQATPNNPQQPQVPVSAHDDTNFISTSHESVNNRGLDMTTGAEAPGKDREPAPTHTVTSAQAALTHEAQVPVPTSAQNVNKPETSWIIAQALSQPHQLLRQDTTRI